MFASLCLIHHFFSIVKNCHENIGKEFMLMWFAVGRMVQFAVPKTQFKGSRSRTVFYQPKSPVKTGISVVPSLTLNSTENECVCVCTH